MPGRIGNPDNLTEIVAARTRTGKVFQIGPGKFRWSASIGPAHVPSDFRAWLRGEPVAWEDPDLTIEPNANGRLAIRKGFFDLEVIPNGIGYTYQSKSAGFVSCRLVEIDGSPVGQTPAPRADGDKIWWDSVRTDLDMYISIGIIKLEIFKLLKSDSAPRSFTWEIEESDPPILSLKTITKGWDNWELLESSRIGQGPGWVRRQVEMLHSQSAFETPKPGIRRYRVIETWSGRTFRLARTEAREKVFLDDYVYPVLIDQDVSEAIVADGDDGDQGEIARMWRPSPYANAHLIQAGGSQNNPGYRFQTVAIPNAATIDAVTFTINVRDTLGTATTATLAGNDVDDAPAWADDAGPIEMPATTATLSWVVPDATGAFATSGASIIAIIQEIVNRAGWASGADLSLGATAVTAGSYKYITDFVAGSNFATLTVDYTEGGAPSGTLLALLPNMRARFGRVGGNLL